MTKRDDSSEPVTKGFLKSELKSELDSLRIELKSELDSLRIELKSELDSLRIEQLTDVREEINEAKSETDQNSRTYRDEILVKMDEVIGELQNMREENILGTHQIRELRKTGVNHEKRIKKLEQLQQAP